MHRSGVVATAAGCALGIAIVALPGPAAAQDKTQDQGALTPLMRRINGGKRLFAMLKWRGA